MAPDQPGSTDRRSRKRAETAEALRWAALRLATEHGYEQLTVEAITEAADVSTRTFFNYYSSKDEALLGSDADTEPALRAALAARPADEPPLLALRAVVSAFVGRLAANGPMWQLRMELLRANPQLWPRMHREMASFETALTEAVAERAGLPATAMYPTLLAAGSLAAVRTALARWSEGSDEAALADLLAAAFDVLAAGFAAPRPGDPATRPTAPSRCSVAAPRTPRRAAARDFEEIS